MKKLKIEEMGRLSPEAYRRSDKLPIIVVLDNIRSMHNVGSIFRTADALKVSSLYLCGITSTPPHVDIHKTALGAEEVVEWRYYANASNVVKELKEHGFAVWAVEQTHESTDLRDIDKYMGESPVALILGNEVNGVSQDVIDLCDGSIEIPQYGTKHSLNVSVAGGIVMWCVSQLYREKE